MIVIMDTTDYIEHCGLFLSYTQFCVKLDANPTVIYSDLDII